MHPVHAGAERNSKNAVEERIFMTRSNLSDIIALDYCVW